MDADGFGEPETCPKCGKPMTQFVRRIGRMFGVGDEATLDSQVGQPNAVK